MDVPDKVSIVACNDDGERKEISTLICWCGFVGIILIDVLLFDRVSQEKLNLAIDTSHFLLGHPANVLEQLF